VTRPARAATVSLLSAFCALAAHAAAYRSFLPSGSPHAYLAWYEPAVGALSLGAAVAVAALAALAAAGRRLPWRLETHGLWSRVAAGGVLVFFAQESLERSLSGAPGVASLSAATLLVVLAAVALSAAVVVVVVRSGVALARLGRRRVKQPRCPGMNAARPQLVAASRRNPLADRRGLRAPPLLAG
jgi:hypothetical protein